jgi:hypothetical protein
VTLPECLTFNISTYSLSINNKIYLWSMRTVTIPISSHKTKLPPQVCFKTCLHADHAFNL